jgi:AcrR family transcriptional regulator
MKNKGLDVRGRILEAVQSLLAENSGLHFSLDLVAKKAGISKGGLLYHFSTKESLLSALIVEYIEQLDQRIELAITGKKLSYHEAYVEVCLSADAIRASRVLNAVGAINEALLMPLDVANKRWRARLSDSVGDKSKGLALSLIMDGYLLSASNEISSVGRAELKQALARIL